MTRYVGTAELLALLGVGRTRLAFLTHRPDFPAPTLTVKMGSVWDLEKVLIWAREDGRAANLDLLPTTSSGEGHRTPTSPAASAELMALFGVSQSRLMVLRRRPEFPRPAITVTMGDIWDLADIRDWAQATGRTLHTATDLLPAAPADQTG